MANVARQRIVPQARTSTEGAVLETAEAAQGESSQTDKVTAALDVIVAYIPTEILTLYVAVLAAI